VLQDGEIDKIGRKQKCKVDVRVLASTNRDLRALVQQKQFREDLFYRLNILRIEVPPLRERGEDILLLFDYFINFYSQDFGIIPPKVDDSAKQVLMNYQWRGNIRQLKSLAQRILLQKVGLIDDLIVHANLGADQQEDASEFIQDSFSQTRILTLKEMEQRTRRKYIQFVREHSQNDKEAASKLGMAPPNYHRMCKELGLK
jgi:DNA-binding NtrC family response regulator